ncbi:MAG: polysaccharide biosynthesis/export family protein [Cyclobacteriaceae bacterium]
MNQTKLTLFILLLSFAACVPTRKQIYLQSEDRSDNPQQDKVLATYQPESFNYQLSTNDVISIKVASATPSEFDILNTQTDRTLGGYSNRDPLLSGYEIEEDGTAFLPVIGKVELAGLTIPEAREKVQNIVSDYLESPTVDIKLLSFSFTVLGAVENEGMYTTYNKNFSLLDAIGVAGGIGDYGDGSKIKIVRHQGEVLQVAHVNILEEDILSSPYYYLKPNDVITVEPHKAKNWQDNTSGNVSLILTALTAVGIFMNVFN